MQKINKTVGSQIISGFLKFLAVAVLFLAIIIIIPLALSIIKGEDIPPVNDSSLQIQTVNIPEDENAFYDLDYDYELNRENLIDTKNIPQGKQLVFDYLESDEWSQEAIKLFLADNEDILQNFSSAADKGKFQLPYTDDPTKISRDMPVTPINGWREMSRLSGVKAIWLAENGQYKEALDEAFKSIIIGTAIENSQSLLITHLVGISIKDNGLDILQKVISIIPKESLALSEYKSKLEKYQAKGNSTPFLIEYIVWKQGLDESLQTNNSDLGKVTTILMKNKFYFKRNLTINYLFDFYSQLAIEANKDCSAVKKVKTSVSPLEKNSLIKMYFTENLIGKNFVAIPDLALNNVLDKKCATEEKLKEIILIINDNE